MSGAFVGQMGNAARPVLAPGLEADKGVKREGRQGPAVGGAASAGWSGSKPPTVRPAATALVARSILPAWLGSTILAASVPR